MQNQLSRAAQLGFSLNHAAAKFQITGVFIAEGTVFAVRDNAVRLHQVPRLAEEGGLARYPEYTAINEYLNTRVPMSQALMGQWPAMEQSPPATPGLVGLFLHKIATGSMEGGLAGPLRSFGPQLLPSLPITPAVPNDPELMTVLADIAGALGAAFCFVSEGKLRSLKLTPIDMTTLQGNVITGEPLAPLLESLNNTYFSAIPLIPWTVTQPSNAHKLQKCISLALGGRYPQLNEELYLSIAEQEQPGQPADLRLSPEDITAPSSETIAIRIQEKTEERKDVLHIPLRFFSDGWAYDLKKELSPAVVAAMALLVEKFGCPLMPYQPMVPRENDRGENNKTTRTNSARLSKERNRYTHSPERVGRLLASGLIKEALFLEISGFPFSMRVANILQNANLKYLGELIRRWNEPLRPLNAGEKFRQEVIAVMASVGIPLPPQAEHLAAWEEIIHPPASRS